MSSRILIAENDCATRGLLAAWLEDAGYACVPTAADEAVAEAEIHRPDAVLVGVDGPDGEGMRIAHSLTASDDAAAVIVVSRPDLEIALAASRLGAIDCLPWPTSERGVVDAVERAVHHRSHTATSRRAQQRLQEAIAHGVAELKFIVEGAHAEAAQAELLALLRLRSPDTYEHALRVADATERLARALKVPEAQIDGIKRAALLHDIGKVAIPSELLDSAAPLDDAQIALLRMHVSIGAEILEHASGLETVGVLVGATHERYDGSGYPMRLRGIDIPLGARIIAVADVYDALTSNRPYRDPLTHDEATLELARVAGSQLDPAVVRGWIHLTGSKSCF